MRINVYKEELTKRIEVVSKTVDGITYDGLRIYLYLPTTQHTLSGTRNVKGPFIHREGDDDSAAVTFWSDREDLHQLVFAMKAALAV